MLYESSSVKIDPIAPVAAFSKFTKFNNNNNNNNNKNNKAIWVSAARFGLRPITRVLLLTEKNCDHCTGRWRTFSFIGEIALIKFNYFLQEIEAMRRINLFKLTVESL